MIGYLVFFFERMLKRRNFVTFGVCQTKSAMSSFEKFP